MAIPTHIRQCSARCHGTEIATVVPDRLESGVRFDTTTKHFVTSPAGLEFSGPFISSRFIQCVGAPDPAPMIATTAFVLVEANSALSAPVGALSGRAALVFQLFSAFRGVAERKAFHGHDSTQHCSGQVSCPTLNSPPDFLSNHDNHFQKVIHAQGRTDRNERRSDRSAA